MAIAIESSDELEQLRTRVRRMSDAELVRFGKAARSLSRDPRCPATFKRQLHEAFGAAPQANRRATAPIEAV